MKWSDIYTYVSEEEATRLLLAAGQAELRKMEPLAGGWANSSYLLTLEDDTQLVLKVWDNKTPIAVERLTEYKLVSRSWCVNSLSLAVEGRQEDDCY